MKLKIERFGGGTQVMQNTADSCANCGDDAKCRRRDFSEQAMSMLLVWGEISAASVDQPICEHCYAELREVLIDRAEEIEAAANVSAPRIAGVAKSAAQSLANKAVRKAS